MLPYGMGVVTAALRKAGYFVEQDDLLVKSKVSVNTGKKHWKVPPVVMAKPDVQGRCLLQGISDSELNQLAEDVLSLTSYDGFDVIGFSVLTYSHFLFALLLAEKIRQKSNAKIVFGGVFITMHGYRFFYRYDFIDFMITGDGEEPVVKLMEFFEGQGAIADIPGLVYRADGEVITNKRLIYSINNMPLPDFEGLPLQLYRRKKSRKKQFNIILPYQASRGCVHNCSYCAQGPVKNQDMKSPEKIIKELQEYSRRYKSRTFIFCDWKTNMSSEHIHRLCDLIIENGLNIFWTGWADVTTVDRKLMEKMKSAGCFSLTIGIESGSNKILESMRRGYTIEDCRKTIRLAHELGFNIKVGFMVGFLRETMADVEDTIRFIKENYKYIDMVTSIQPFVLEAGTSIYNNPERYNIYNIKSLNGIKEGCFFTFDEKDGLSWEERLKFQKKAYCKILKMVFAQVFTRYMKRPWIPFWMWFLNSKVKGRFSGLSKF
ncbi:MAG: radical SAM protein [Elusimicrobiota bacterium]